MHRLSAALGLMAACGLVLLTAAVAGADPLTIVPDVLLSEEYTDNLFFTEDPQEDFVTRLFINLAARYDTPRWKTTLRTGTSAIYLAKHTDQSGFSAADAQQFFLSSTYQFTQPLSVSVRNGFVHSGRARDLSFITSPGGVLTPLPPSDPSGNNPNNTAVLLPRGSALNNSFGAAAAYAFLPRWTTTLSYTNGYGSFSDPDSTTLTQAGAFTLGHQLNPTVSLNGSYAYSRLNNTTAPDSESNAVTVGGSYTYDPQWNAFASVGVSFNHGLEAGGVPQRTNGVFNVGINGQIQERAGIGAGASQQVGSSLGVAGTAITLNAYLTGWMEIVQFLNGTVMIGYTNFDTSTSDFYIFYTQAALFYPVWRDVFAGVVYGFRTRDTEPGIDAVPGETINGNSVRLQISTAWPFRFDL